MVDDEKQTDEKFCELYYDLGRINQVENSFIYPGYSFNTGQWFGTPGILSRDDFSDILPLLLSFKGTRMNCLVG